MEEHAVVLGRNITVWHNGW